MAATVVAIRKTIVWDNERMTDLGFAKPGNRVVIEPTKDRYIISLSNEYATE